MSEFEPRRAEPGQEFGYTTSEESTIPEGEDVPEGVTLLSTDEETGDRRVRTDGVQRTLKADSEGVVHPKTLEDVQMLDTFALPVARAAMKAPEAPKPPQAKE